MWKLICHILNHADWITAISAFLGLIVGLPQLFNLSKTRSAEFINRFKKDFFNEQTRILLFFIDLDLISFKEPDNKLDDSCFMIDRTKVQHLSDNFQQQKKFASDCNYIITTWDIDDLLLGHFEDLGLFRKKRVIDIEFIYESFDWYIQRVHDNSAIKQYVKWQRKQENSEDVYYFFDFIATECKKYK